MCRAGWWPVTERRRDDERWPRDTWLDAIWDCPDVKPNERAVAYAYARYSGSTDITWCPWDELKRRTGIRSRDALSRAISGLVEAGWIVEVERARQHYSARYRLTVAQQSVSRTPEIQESASRTSGTVQVSASRTSERPSSPSGETSSPFNGPDLSNGPLEEDPLPRATGIDSLAAEVGATEEEMSLLVEKVRRDHPHVKAVLPWLRRVHEHGDLAPMLAEVRAQMAPAEASTPDRCGECDARYDNDPISARVVWLPNGSSVRCPRCHPHEQRTKESA